MWRLKGCPKCGGDLCLDVQVHPAEWLCLQCGLRPYEYQVAQIEPDPFPSARQPSAGGYGELADSGCDFYRRCLDCPMPKCWMDTCDDMVILRRNGMSFGELARRTSLPVSQIKGIVGSRSRGPRRVGMDASRRSPGQALRRPA